MRSSGHKQRVGEQPVFSDLDKTGRKKELLNSLLGFPNNQFLSFDSLLFTKQKHQKNLELKLVDNLKRDHHIDISSTLFFSNLI